jgi:hypothetical protein
MRDPFGWLLAGFTIGVLVSSWFRPDLPLIIVAGGLCVITLAAYHGPRLYHWLFDKPKSK